MIPLILIIAAAVSAYLIGARHGSAGRVIKNPKPQDRSDKEYVVFGDKDLAFTHEAVEVARSRANSLWPK